MSAFIQLTDTHIVPEGELAYGRSDTAAALEAAVATINEKLPLLGAVSFVLVTGDLTDHGTDEEYARFKKIMSRLDLPYLAIPGNHDLHAPMRKAFADADWMPEAGPIHWRHDLDAFTLIGLDTLIDGAHYGDLSAEGFDFLDRTLADLGDRPAVVATHHPWIHSGIRAMDADNLRNGAAMMDRLQAHPGPVRMVSGHVHRAVTAQIGKVTCQIGPAPCHAVHLDCREDTSNDLIMEPGGMTLYHWIDTPHPGLASHVVPVGTFDGPWPFDC